MTNLKLSFLFTFLLMTIVSAYGQDFKKAKNTTLNLQLVRSKLSVSFPNTDAHTDKQFEFTAGLDRMFNRYFGAGIDMGYLFLGDKNGYFRLSAVLPGDDVDIQLHAGGVRRDYIFSMKVAPLFQVPFGKSSLTLRPAAGVAGMFAHQNLLYDITDHGVAYSMVDEYDYKPLWMLALGAHLEYTYSFEPDFAAFISVGGEWLHTKQTFATFDTSKEHSITDFPEYVQPRLMEMRSEKFHQTGSIDLVQIGMGVRFKL